MRTIIKVSLSVAVSVFATVYSIISIVDPWTLENARRLSPWFDVLFYGGALCIAGSWLLTALKIPTRDLSTRNAILGYVAAEIVLMAIVLATGNTIFRDTSFFGWIREGMFWFALGGAALGNVLNHIQQLFVRQRMGRLFGRLFGK